MPSPVARKHPPDIYLTSCTIDTADLPTTTTSTLKAICPLQLLHQLNIVLLRRRRRDLILDSDLFPRIILVLLLHAPNPHQRRKSLRTSSPGWTGGGKEERRTREGNGVGLRDGGSNLKREAAGLSGLGEVFACALLVVCVQLDGRDR